MELNYLQRKKFSLFRAKKDQQMTKKDIIKFIINLLIWITLTHITYRGIEIIHRDGVASVKAFFEMHPNTMWLNLLVLHLITSPGLLFKRTHFYVGIVCFMSVGLAYISYLVLGFRGVPLMWYDAYNISEAATLATQYLDREIIIQMSFAVVGVIVILMTMFFIRYKQYCVALWLRFLIWILVVFSLGMGINHLKTEGAVESIPWDMNLSYERNSFVYSFVESFLSTFREEPTGYSRESIARIQEGIVPLEKTDEQPNIIMVQLEGVMDPYILEGISYSEDALANFRRMGEDHVGGLIQVPTMGGGTVRTEFEMLTSMNMDLLAPGEMPYNSGVMKRGPVESLAYVLKDEGYNTTVMHNFQGNFYSRNTVFASMGFDTFIPMEAMVNLQKLAGVWPRDHVLLDYIQKTIAHTPESDFIYAIAVSSHGPFTEGAIPENYIEVTGDLSESHKAELEIYLQRLKEVDLFVGNLMNYVESLDEHTVLVVFSDHYPSMGVVERVEGSEKFLVPFAVMDNKRNLTSEIPSELEAYELSTYVLQLYGIEGGLMNQYQRSYREDSDYGVGLAHLQYDMLFGHKYSTGGKTPYTISDMVIGMNELEVDGLKKDGESWLVQGDGFNQSSKAYVDNQEVYTEYIDQNTLYIDTQGLEPSGSVHVRQLGRNDIPLLDSNVFKIE